MTVIVYHGEDVDSSYKAMADEVVAAKKNGWTIVKAEGKELDRERFFSLLAQDDFFSQGKLIVINGLLSRVKSKARDELIKLVQESDEKIILWEGKKLTSASEKLLTQAEKHYFAQKDRIWALLATWSNDNRTEKFITLYEETLAQSEPLYVLAMFLWQVEQLLEVKAGVFAGAPFRRATLAKQAGKITTKEALNWYNKLLDLDYRSKSGGLKLSLEKELLEVLLGVF